MISGASEEELIEAIGRADVLLEFMPKIKQLQQENKKLNGAIQTYDILLKANTEENKKLKKVIDRASARLEYFLIGNLKYQSSQEEFIKLLNILKEVSE